MERPLETPRALIPAGILTTITTDLPALFSDRAALKVDCEDPASSYRWTVRGTRVVIQGEVELTQVIGEGHPPLVELKTQAAVEVWP